MSALQTALALFASSIALWFLLRHISFGLIYKPTGSSSPIPQNLAPEFTSEAVWFNTKDGKTLHGWFCSEPDNSAVMLLCHGNKGSIEGREDSVEFYMQMGLNVFIFDYRGYGFSQGRTSERGTELDVRAAWRYLREDRHIDPANIVLLGRSLGAAIAAQLAQTEKPGAVILESTFTSIGALAGELHPWLKHVMRHQVRYDTAAKMASITSPLLLVHSKEDELIDYHHANDLLSLSPKGTALVTISGRHRDGFVSSRQIYFPAVTKFLIESGIKLNKKRLLANQGIA